MSEKNDVNYKMYLLLKSTDPELLPVITEALNQDLSDEQLINFIIKPDSDSIFRKCVEGAIHYIKSKMP